MARMHRRYKKNPAREYRPNPPLMTDLVEFVVPGFGGFAASRFVTRAAATQIAKRAPSWGKHAGAVAAVGSFLAAWFLAHRWSALAKHHTPIVVGSAIAGLQSLIQLYIPALGWIVGDATPELAAGQQQSDLTLAQSMPHLLPTNDDPNEYTYNDAYDAGRYSRPPAAAKSPVGAGTGPGGPAQNQTDLSDLALNDAIGSASLGVFQN